MDNLITLEFEYRLESYFAIVRTKTNKGEKHYHITIMNGNLERMLYGNHIFIEADGVLQSGAHTSKMEVAELRLCIAIALCHHLQASGSPVTQQEYSNLN